MKTLIQIILRYAFSAVGVLLLLLTLNVGVFLAALAAHMESDVLEYRISDLAQGMVETETGWELSPEELSDLRENYAWAMLLDGEGRIAWSDRLPKSLNHPYTLGQVASFSRWYLEDYPVYVYEQGDGLFVLGSAKDTRWKYSVIGCGCVTLEKNAKQFIRDIKNRRCKEVLALAISLFGLIQR